MESLLTNGNTMEFSEDSSQGLTQPRLKEEAGRLQRSLRNLKGLLTQEINASNDKIGHFKLRYSDDSTEITTVQIGYAQNIIDNHTRCQIRFVNLEKALEKLRQIQCDIWEGDDEELDAVVDKLNQDLVSYEH